MDKHKRNELLTAPRSKKEMAAEMQISIRTFHRRLKSAGIDTGRTLIPPKKIMEIFEKLNWNLD